MNNSSTLSRRWVINEWYSEVLAVGQMTETLTELCGGAAVPKSLIHSLGNHVLAKLTPVLTSDG